MTISRFNKGFISVSAALTVLFSMPFAASIFMQQQSVGTIYDQVEQVPEKKVAMVLGAAAYPSRLSDILQDRVDTGIDLYETGKVKQLLMTGAPNEVEGMRVYALEHGVAEGDILEDPAGLNTLASVRNAVEQFDEMVIVTQAFHLPRALFMANHFDVDAVGMASDRREYRDIFDFKKRELLASTKAMMDLFWHY